MTHVIMHRLRLAANRHGKPLAEESQALTSLTADWPDNL